MIIIGKFLVRKFQLLDWIKHNLSMSGLIVKSYYRAAVPVNSEEVQQLICKHPALIELDLPNYRFTVDDAISVICELNLLEKFRFQMLRSDYTYFKNQLSVVWQIKECGCGHSNYTVLTLNR